MQNLRPRHVNTEEALRLGVVSGWYSTKVSGTFVSGPHDSEAACASARSPRLIREPSPAVNIELHQAFVSHFQQEGLTSFFIQDIGAFHDLAQFERLLAERTQDIFSIIQHY